jgi:hypothetical protein
MTTIYKGITVPDLTDPPNAPEQLRAMVDTGGAVPRFADLAAARVAYPAGQRPLGMMVGVGLRLYISNGSDFVSIAAGGIENFVSAAARAAALSSPALNTATSLDTDPGVVWLWNGTAWAPATDGRPLARAITTADHGTIDTTGGAVGPLTNFTLTTSRCVSITVAAQHLRSSVGLMESSARVGASKLVPASFLTRHDTTGGPGQHAGGFTTWIDLAAGTYNLQFYIRSPAGGAIGYLLAGSRLVAADAGPNRGLFPF